MEVSKNLQDHARSIFITGTAISESCYGLTNFQFVYCSLFTIIHELSLFHSAPFFCILSCSTFMINLPGSCLLHNRSRSANHLESCWYGRSADLGMTHSGCARSCRCTWALQHKFIRFQNRWSVKTKFWFLGTKFRHVRTVPFKIVLRWKIIPLGGRCWQNHGCVGENNFKTEIMICSGLNIQ